MESLVQKSKKPSFSDGFYHPKTTLTFPGLIERRPDDQKGFRPLKVYTDGIENMAWQTGYSSGNYAAITTTTKEANALFVEVKGTSSTSIYIVREFVTTAQIDFTNYKLLVVEWECIQNSGAVALSLVTNTNVDPNASGRIFNKNSIYSRTIDTWDISSYNGSYNLAFYARAGQNGWASGRVYKIYLV